MNANHKHDQYTVPSTYTQSGWISTPVYQPIKSNNGYGCALFVALVTISVVVYFFMFVA